MSTQKEFTARRMVASEMTEESYVLKGTAKARAWFCVERSDGHIMPNLTWNQAVALAESFNADELVPA